MRSPQQKKCKSPILTHSAAINQTGVPPYHLQGRPLLSLPLPGECHQAGRALHRRRHQAPPRRPQSRRPLPKRWRPEQLPRFPAGDSFCLHSAQSPPTASGLFLPRARALLDILARQLYHSSERSMKTFTSLLTSWAPRDTQASLEKFPGEAGIFPGLLAPAAAIGDLSSEAKAIEGRFGNGTSFTLQILNHRPKEALRGEFCNVVQR